MRYLPYQLVQDFFHQQYHASMDLDMFSFDNKWPAWNMVQRDQFAWSVALDDEKPQIIVFFSGVFQEYPNLWNVKVGEICLFFYIIHNIIWFGNLDASTRIYAVC